ncbi:MAG TPA: sulfate ABC transporter substrate-binding protein [Leptolyngbyaceae cyanobacterium M33_DOE_097]|uniref:Sulfate ABC transporter substrate-binding protein n=1 Tax=Oscillatoriales cyanobacterium SpSt-418 TaxID=2282169 RepID=A0A7C3KHH7_9CYAN|nr:sulfate ABC transporter substrate-binding protein [Leptolyngbyaceae cyanobacterium M33_DOE_097]
MAIAAKPLLGLRSIKRFVAFVLLGMLLSFGVAACSGSNSAGLVNAPNVNLASNRKQTVELTLVAYAVPKAAYDVILPKFAEYWKAQQGQEVRFSWSYGGSGAQTRALIDGLEADVVHLAIGADVEKLVKAGFVSENWRQRVPNNGIVGETVAAIVTRAGNPKNIRTFGDLARPDVRWVTADPKTSGGARWNYFALWNYAKQTGLDDAKAQEFMTRAYQNVAVLARDARESTDAFANQGQGDALVNYENEIILARQKGEELDYTVPAINFSIDTPVTVIDKTVDRRGTREVAEAFVNYLFTPEAQREFAKVGFRPLGAVAQEKEFKAQFPPIQKLGTIDDYGGWQATQKVFEDGGTFDQVRSQLGR